MKKYSLEDLDVIGGRKNNSDIYIKSVNIGTDHTDDGFHVHFRSDEYYVILEGEIELTTRDEKKVFTTGDIICCESGEEHYLSQTLKPTKMLVIKRTEFISKRNL